MSTFLFGGGEEERDAGIAQTQLGQDEWFARALMMIRALPRSWEGISESWRPIIEAKIGPPRHHNTWGALTMTASRYGIIVDTGVRVKMRLRRSHARKSPIWRRV